MIKINEKNLCVFATSNTPVDHQGWLETRIDVPNKSYHKRWFVLKGNLLFYFDKKGDREPVGLIILEGCTIELTEEETYGFKIVFHCDGGRTYCLSTDSQSSMEQWMKALAYAGYDYMRLMVADLKRQLEEAEADLETKTKQPVGEPIVPPRGQRYNPFNVTPEHSSGKAVHGSRHNKDPVRSSSVVHSKITFRDLHAQFGRPILSDKSHWRAAVAKRQVAPVEVPALIQL